MTADRTRKAIGGCHKSANHAPQPLISAMGVLKACYSLDIIHERENVPHFILDGETGKRTNSFLSRPSDPESNVVMVVAQHKTSSFL